MSRSCSNTRVRNFLNKRRVNDELELYIIRHGQSTNNALPDDSQATRVNDAPLTDLGKRQAEALATYLATGASRDPWTNPNTGYSQPLGSQGIKFTHLYCSPMYRAMQTTFPVADALGMQPEIWVDVHENGGVYLDEAGKITGFPGRTRAQIAQEFPNYVIPDGVTESGWWNPQTGMESISACYGRAIKIAAELKRRAQDQAEKSERIALITHGTFTDALIKALLNQLPNRSIYYLHYNTAITRIDFEKDHMIVRYLNRVDHLSPDLIS